MEGEEEKRRWAGPKKQANHKGLRHAPEPLGAGQRLKPSSRAWIERQLDDPYVHRAQLDGFRSRAAYKLLEIDEKFGILQRHSLIVDLGCAPGGWIQAALRNKCATIIGVDLLPMVPITGAHLIQGDFTDANILSQLRGRMCGKADLILSDMAPNTTGHADVDHIRIVSLLENAVQFAFDDLKPGGAFVGKIFQGGAQSDLLMRLKRGFQKVAHFKPKASRAESSELYLIARGFRGEADQSATLVR